MMKFISLLCLFIAVTPLTVHGALARPKGIQQVKKQAAIAQTYKLGDFTVSVGTQSHTNFKLDVDGLPRAHQKPFEDRMALRYNSSAQTLTVSIFDGHAGHQLSEYLGKNFCNLFDKSTAQTLQERIRAGLHGAEDAFKRSYEKNNKPLPRAGSTATVLHIDNKKVTMGWIGDSTAVVYQCPQERDTIYFHATTEHHVSHPQELERIADIYGGKEAFTGILNAYYEDKNFDYETFLSVSSARAWKHALKLFSDPQTIILNPKNLRIGGLNLARDLGSFELKKIGPTINNQKISILSNEPEFWDVDLEEGMIIVAASDGLWDYFVNDNGEHGITPAKLYPLIQKLRAENYNCQQIADFLVQQSSAYSFNGYAEYRDDITVVITEVNKAQ